MYKSKIYPTVKRILDFFLSFILLILASPLLAVLTIAVGIKLGRPILFTQSRPGAESKIFKLYKFRSMVKPDPARGISTDQERLTPFGKFLRSTSLDELPSILNVLKGDMSFVGPRPLLVDYLPLYSREQLRRHTVRPGITGLAQIRGRNNLDWEQKFELDVYYVDHLSFRLDAEILLGTVSTVFKRTGISHEGDATMPAFKGSNDNPDNH